MGSVLMRTATPADYDAIASVVDDWWGRPYEEFFRLARPDRPSARSSGKTWVS